MFYFVLHVAQIGDTRLAQDANYGTSLEIMTLEAGWCNMPVEQ
jgi:hypothetical protein